MKREIQLLRRFRALACCAIAAAVFAAGTLPAVAQSSTQPSTQPEASPQSPESSQSSAASITPNDENESTWPIDQLLPLTVSEAWQLSGKNEEKFFDIVQQLAAFSAEKRGLKLPDSAAAGKRAGEYIKTQAKADHGQLLYAIVDRAVRRVGTQATTAASTTAK